MFPKFKSIMKNISSIENMESLENTCQLCLKNLNLSRKMYLLYGKYPRMFEITILFLLFLRYGIIFPLLRSDAAEVWQLDHKILQHL
jgi:hypothetical protein